MFIVANFLVGLAQVIDMALQLFMWLIIARAVLSWVNPDPYNPIVRFLNQTTSPTMNWVRKKIPTTFGGLDLSPLIVIFGIYFLRTFVVQSLVMIAQRIG